MPIYDSQAKSLVPPLDEDYGPGELYSVMCLDAGVVTYSTVESTIAAAKTTAIVYIRSGVHSVMEDDEQLEVILDRDYRYTGTGFVVYIDKLN